MENSRTRGMRAIFHGGENVCRPKTLERKGGFINRKRKDTGDNDKSF